MSFAVVAGMRLAILSIVLAACASPPPPASPVSPTPAPAPPPPAPVTASLPSMSSPEPTPPPAAAPPQQGRLEHAMRNCPTAIAGVATRARNTPFGVDLTVTANDPASQRRIVELAARHEHTGDPDGSVRQHTGMHGGPGTLGRCPVIHSDTIVTFTRIRKGVVIHVNALFPKDVAHVQAIVNDRLGYLAER